MSNGRYQIDQTSFSGGEIDADTYRPDYNIFPHSLSRAENVLLTTKGCVVKRYGSRIVGQLPPSEHGEYKFVKFQGENDDGETYWRLVVFGHNCFYCYKIEFDIDEETGKQTARYTLLELYPDREGDAKYAYETDIPANKASQMTYELIDTRIVFAQQALEPFWLSIEWPAETAEDFEIKKLITNNLLLNIPKKRLYPDEVTLAALGVKEITITEENPGYATLSTTMEQGRTKPFANENLRCEGEEGTITDDAWVGCKLMCKPIGILKILQKEPGVTEDKLRVQISDRTFFTAKIEPGSCVLQKGYRRVMDGGDYPACVGKFAWRLYFGGMRTTPNGVMASRSAIDDSEAYFDFNEGHAGVLDGFFLELGNAQTSKIRYIHARDQYVLMCFCNKSIWIVDGNPTPGNANFRSVTDKKGIARGTPVISLPKGGSSVFIDDAAWTVQKMEYDDNTKTYGMDDLSILATKLVTINKRPWCMDLWEDRTLKTPYVSFLDVKGDMITLLYNEANSICGFTRQKFYTQTTDGYFEHIGCTCLTSFAGDLFFAGELWSRFLCVLDEDRLLDFSVMVTAEGNYVRVPYNERHLVYAFTRDGVVHGPLQIEKIDEHNYVDLGTEDYDGQEVEVGFGFYPIVKTQPLDKYEQMGLITDAMKHINKTTITPIEVSNLLINRETAVREQPNAAVREPFTFKNFYGWGLKQQIELTQDTPGLFGINCITSEVEVNT